MMGRSAGSLGARGTPHLARAAAAMLAAAGVPPEEMAELLRWCEWRTRSAMEDERRKRPIQIPAGYVLKVVRDLAARLAAERQEDRREE